MRIFYLVVLIGSVIGSIVVPYQGQFARWWTFYAIVSALEMVHLFYWTNTRMRAPLTPALDLMAAAVFLRTPKEPNQTAEQTPEA